MAATKRKSDPTSSAKSTKPAKAPRLTLDSFFAQTVDGHSAGQPGPSLGLSSLSSKGDSVRLSREQNRVLQAVEDGQNIFFTGAAGTGKSLLLRHIIDRLRKKYAKTPDAVAVTASTGMAATNIGGMTLHSWGAIAPGTQDVDQLISYIRVCRPALQRWKKVTVLIIDEVSMVSGELFERVCAIADRLRASRKTNKDRPCGGIQIVLTGDFFQLPPIQNNAPPSSSTSQGKQKQQQPVSFAFESPAWARTIERSFELNEVFRQKGDDELISLLNALRHGRLAPEHMSRLAKLSRPLPMEIPSIAPTELFPLRAQVAAANNTFLARLHGDPRKFVAKDSFHSPSDPSDDDQDNAGGGAKGKGKKKANRPPPKANPKLLENLMAPEVLEVKIGAQVMLVKNIDNNATTPSFGASSNVGLVNGCVGKVVGFCSREALLGPSSAKGKSSRSGAGFVRGVTITPEGPRVEQKVKHEDVDKENQAVDPKKPAWKSNSKAPQEDEQFPLVEFPVSVVNGKKLEKRTEVVLVCRDEFRVEDSDGNLLARRVQVPLVLAWAMSIHKSQGQTIQRVKVDLGRIFETGQTYVALSRVTSLGGLQVLRFDPKKVMVNETVLKWAETFASTT